MQIAVAEHLYVISIPHADNYSSGWFRAKKLWQQVRV